MSFSVVTVRFQRVSRNLSAYGKRLESLRRPWVLGFVRGDVLARI